MRNLAAAVLTLPLAFSVPLLPGNAAAADNTAAGAGGAGVARADTVVWAMSHLPPFSITEGEAGRRGMAQILTDLIAARTPTLRHTTEPMTFNRMTGLAKAGRTLCSTILVKTIERETFLTFSAPVLGILPNRLYMARGRLMDWADANGEEVDLDAAFARGLTIAVPRGRFHGEVIDEALIRWRNRVEEVGSVEAAMRLVAAGRVDATLMFGEQYAYLREKDASLPELVSAGVRGTVLSDIRVSCTKGAEGDRLVARMEAALDVGLRAELLAAYRATLPPDLVAVHHRMSAGTGPASADAVP